MQTAVTEGQVIISAEVTQEENDMNQMHPMLCKANEELKVAGIGDKIEHALFDAGYCSEENLSKTAEGGPEIFAATTKDWKQQKALKERGSRRGRIPKGLTKRELMERKLLTKKGQEMYGRRKIIVEPPFGQMKEGQGFRRFMVRGIKSVASEVYRIRFLQYLFNLGPKTVMCPIRRQRRISPSIFVPSIATIPTFTNPASPHIRRTSVNNLPSASRCSFRNRLIVL